LKSLILRRKTSQILAKGITLVELFLTMLVAGIIIQLAYLGFSWNRQLYLNDQARNEASQNLATAFSIIGSDIKQAGAGLDASFPAVLIRPYPTNPTGTPNLNSPDFNSEITLRRLISGTQPRTCKNNATPAATTISGSPTEIFVLNSAPPLVAGCNNDTAGIAVVTALKTYRLQNGGTVRIFIYPSTTGTGEFLNYTGENFDTNYTSLIVNGTLTGTYNIDSAKIMLIEERKYRLGCSDSSIADASCPTNKLQNLQLIVNDGNPVNLVNNLGTFAVTATIQQDVTNTTTAQFICWLINQTGNPSCNSSVTGYVWSDLYSINVTLRPQFDSDSGSILSTGTQDTINSLQQTQNFLPRNVLNY
jgi:type IV pilus assembly protein PilW